MKRAICIAAVAGLAFACNPEGDTIDAFRDALPEQDDLKVKIGSDDNEDTNQQTELDPYSECTDETCCTEEVGGELYYVSGDVYEATRSAKWHVNGALATTFVWIEAIILFPYSEETENGYIWGPWKDDTLSRVDFRFAMDKTATDEFSFRLEGKHINNPSDDWTPIVEGEVQAGSAPHRGTGTMLMDFDALHEIDASHPWHEGGKVTYEFDVREYPYTVTVDFDDFVDWGEDTLNAVYEYERYEGLAGLFRFTASVDVVGPEGDEDARDDVLEQLVVESRWTAQGMGSGTSTVSGGTLSGWTSDVVSYTLSECWGDSACAFYATYEATEIEFGDGTPVWSEVGCGDVSYCPVFE